MIINLSLTSSIFNDLSEDLHVDVLEGLRLGLVSVESNFEEAVPIPPHDLPLHMVVQQVHQLSMAHVLRRF